MSCLSFIKRKGRKTNQHFCLEPHTLYCSLDYNFFFKLYFVVVNLLTNDYYSFSISSLGTLKIPTSTELHIDFFSAVFIHLLRITSQTTLKTLFLICSFAVKYYKRKLKLLCLIWSIFRFFSILAGVLSLRCKLFSKNAIKIFMANVKFPPPLVFTSSFKVFHLSYQFAGWEGLWFKTTIQKYLSMNYLGQCCRRKRRKNS